MVGLAGCGPDDGGQNNATAKRCETTADCPDDAVCAARRCEVASTRDCANDLDCAAYEYCAIGTCRLDGCESDDGCADNAVCDAGRCRSGCRGDQDCQSGARCSSVTRTCVSQSCAPGDCATFQFCDDTRDPAICRYDGSCDTEATCQAYARQLADDTPYICREGMCRPKPPCQSNRDCGDAQICIVVDNGRNYCRAGCETTQDCLLAEYCSQDRRCVDGCTSDADCTGADQVCVDLQCEQSCAERSDCAGAGLQGWVCTGEPSHCQLCRRDNQCFGGETCALDADTTPAGQGLCQPLPPDCPDDGFGDNDAQDQAVALDDFPVDHRAADRPVFCRANELGDNGQDWYALSAAPGKVVVVEIEYDAAVGGNLDVALVDAGGNDVVASARPPTVDGGIERIEYGIDPQGSEARQLWVHVRGSIVEANVAYRLHVDVTDPQTCADDGFEDNDTAGQAQPLPAAPASHPDLQVCGDDADFYRLDVGPNQIVDVTVESQARLGQVQAYLNRDGQTVASTADAPAGMRARHVRYATDAAATLTLEIRVQQGAGRANYALSWTTQDNICTDALEGPNGNNTCQTAARVDASMSYTDLHICEDNDYYCTVLGPRDRLRVTASYDPASSAGNLQMTLFGPNDCGAFLASASEVPADASGETQLVIADADDPSLGFEANLGGTYCVLASRFSGIQVPYSLDVDVQPGPVCQDDGYEDNDRPADAVVIDPAEVPNNGPQSALLGRKICDYDQDWYQIDIAAGDTLGWSLRQDVQRGRLVGAVMADATTPVVDAAGDPLVVEADGQVEVTNDSAATTTYYLMVAGADELPVRTDYRVLTEINGEGSADPGCPDRLENNDTAAQASAVSPGGQPDLLACGGDADWFKTDVAAGETITAAATFDNAAGNLDIALFEAADLQTPARQSATSADTETVALTTAKAQTIYVRVTADAQVDANAYAVDIDVAAAPACADDEFEANDASANAAPLGDGGLYPRLMSCEDDADWYQVELTADRRFEAYINYDDVQAGLNVAIYRPGELGQPAASGEHLAGFVPPAGGAYFIRVGSASPADSVRLAYDLLVYRDLDDNGAIDAGEGPADRQCPDRFENNDQFGQAAIVPAGTYADVLTCGDDGGGADSDYFAIYVPAGARVDANTILAEPGRQLDLWLYDGDRQLVDRSISQTAGMESVSGHNTANVGQLYYVRVDPLGDAESNYYELSLALDFDASCPGDDLDPNGQRASAKPLGAESLGLTLCEATEDWFEMTLDPGELATVHVELDQRLGDIDVELRSATDAVLDASTTTGAIETVGHTNQTGAVETVYVRVFAKGGAAVRNDYDLWASIGTDTPTAPYCPDGYERNDTPATSAKIDVEAAPQLADAIMCGREADWYEVELGGADTYEVAAFFERGPNFDLAIQLEDAAGQPVADTDGQPIDFGSHTATVDEIRRVQPPSPGAYFVGVKQVAAPPAAQGDYGLLVDAQADGCPEDDLEPNNTVGGRRQIGAGLHALGMCDDGAGSAEDYFEIVAPADGTMTIMVMYDDSSVQMDGLVNGGSNGLPNMASTARRLTYSTSVSAGVAQSLQLTRLGGEGPYFVDVQFQ